MMFLSDPVTIWFRRKSVDSEISPTKLQPSISVTEDGEDENDNTVFSSPSTSACSSRSSSPCPSPSKLRGKGRKSKPPEKKEKEGGKKSREKKSSEKKSRILGRSVSSCTDSSASKRTGQNFLPPPLIFVNGDSPHRLERSLSNTLDLTSSYDLAACSAWKGPPLHGRCFDFDGIPDKLRCLQDEWKTESEWGKGMSVTEGSRSKEGLVTSFRSNSRLSIGSPTQISPHTLYPDASEDDGIQLCQSPKCSTLDTATRVCHHPQCMEENGDLPLLLCRPCDLHIHRQPEFSGHLVLDRLKKRPPGPPAVKQRSAKSEHDGESDSDSPETTTQQNTVEDQVDGLFVKNNSKVRNRSPSSELERKLQRKRALKKKGAAYPKTDDGLDLALAQIADPEGDDFDTLTRMDTDADYRIQKDPFGRRDSGLGEYPNLQRQETQDSPPEILNGGGGWRTPVRRQSKVTLNDNLFTLVFCMRDNLKEEVVAAVENTTLRDAIEPVLLQKGLDVNSVHVFIANSRTPLPMSCDSLRLGGTTLEIKEKDEKDNEQTTQVKKQSSGNKSSSGKNNKQSGRNSRRDSVGVVPLLLEPPPNKQRRGSLQLPFREHFFNKGDSKGGDGLKVYDDSFGSLRGRGRSGNLSIDDTFYPPTSPGGTLTEGKKNKSQKLSVVNLFTPTANKDRERQDQLTEILNRYSANGLPALPDLLNILRPQFKEELFIMELNWHLLVDGDENLTKKQQEHQEAVWELLHTEVSYIKQIRVIIDVFQNCLINVQNEGFLNDIETERLFSNIDKIYECNCSFWQQFLLPVLAASRENHKPLDPLICKGGFVEHFQQKFEVYFKYFIEHKSCLDYAKSCMENNDLFKTFITWAETQKQCNRLKMADLMVKPMQRLLKYSLLLQAILRHTENESERADIKEMIQSVEKLCWAANNSLQRRDEYEKLDAVRKTIEPYDAIEAPTDECTKIIQEYSSNFSLLAPVPGFRDGQPRSLLFQSSLRMKEAQNTKLDVDCLLFTDLILICKSNRKMDKFKIIRPPMRLDQLVVRELKDKGSFLLIYMNECQVPISAFAFHSDTGAIRGWLEKFREAQKDFKNRKIQESLPPDRRGTAVAIQEEGEFQSLTSVPSDLNINSFPRSDSMESADHFMPNLLTPGDFTSDSLELGRSGSTGDIQNGPMSGHKAMTHTNTDPKMVLSLDPSPSDPQWPGGSISGGNNVNLSAKHKPVQTSRSVPNITVGNVNQSPTNSLLQSSNDNGYRGLNESSADGNTGFTSNQGKDAFSASQVSHSDQHIVFSEDESSKQKSSTRRVSRTEKRYHTADAIQDMKFSEKDTSIHKRLSWRIDVDQTKNLGSKVSSTDSSSWVSSTGSLPSNPESDISKEIESGFSSSSDHHRQKIFLLGGAEELGNEDDSDMTDLESSQNMSKSTPDLVTMFSSTLHVSELKDGIASVAVDGFNRKLTRDDIRKMKLLKHQVLYDANIESSEV